MFRSLCSRTLVNESKALFPKIFNRHYVNYVQGQSPQPGIREYFYYINHEGMLFLDDARVKNFTSCFKDTKFLIFFFKNLGINVTNRYTEDFPYISRCGRELNFVRCDDLPFVFTKIVQTKDDLTGEVTDVLFYARVEKLLQVKFQPDKLYMNVHSGRIYHPAPAKGGKIGLVASKLAIELSSQFEFENGEENAPTHFNWRGKRYSLDTDWVKLTHIKVNNLGS
nr:PREDICTED: UPF0598 protein CG30010 [Megachile rotundata]